MPAKTAVEDATTDATTELSGWWKGNRAELGIVGWRISCDKAGDMAQESMQ